MGRRKQTPEYRPIKDAHKTLGLWSIRRALTFAFTAAVVLLVAAWFLLLWLLGSPTHAEPMPLDTKDVLELLKLVFALVAGVGALVALVTAYRRQRVDEAAGERAERVQAHVEYGQAVELLGHDKAAVRLGGLYSLERLAQDHPYYRQTVTDVVCSYLRMPFKSPFTDHGGQADRSRQPDDHTPHDPETSDAPLQELQVRLTAQRLLKRHLTITSPDQEPPPTYWGGINIDLTGAHLVDFEFTHCRPREARFLEAHFNGVSVFDGAHFDGPVWFNRALFSGSASFMGARFSGITGFFKVRFGETSFDLVNFGEIAMFAMSHFNGNVEFFGAHFENDAFFDNIHCKGDASFKNAQFGRQVHFREARFGGTASFEEAHFRDEPDFAEAVASYPNDDHVWPRCWRAQAIAGDAAQLTRCS
ncbi:pentapeptide repeat-containing protein [Actinomadura chokoriensis]|uniref:Pentapeptide repeat-containing protein n=1 Tax=Actinomadura chokoriensis TaxID=454156 RepID=A0ABV4QUX2_9ACTN